MAARIVYEFSNFRLDPQQRLLLCGADQRPVPLPPKVFETLLYFVERRGELLEKGTLLKAIWPNVVVEENSLNQNISTLRRVLGESPGEHRYIATEPGRGYRFVADVRTVVAPGAAQVTSDRPAAVASVGAAAPERKSIAVLPFANLTGDPAKEYLSDGMAEELIHMLARVPGLKVPARTSSFAYKGRNTDVRQIARDLGVATVLEGSVRGASERIRITAQLIDGQSGYHLWSQSYDREFGDLFKLQDELANAIVATLRATLDGKLPGRVHLEAPTRDLTAYQLYLQAQAMQVVGGEPVLRSAVEMLKAAITRDPRFARAYTALATLRAVAIVQGFKLAGTVADTERELQQAVTLDPGPGATHAALGIMHAVQGKWLSAEEQFQEAIARDREDPATWQAHGMHVTGSAGHLKRYLDDALEAHRLAPVWMGNLLNLAVACMLEERLEEARKHLESGISLGLPPTMTPIADVLSQLEAREGRPAAGAQFILDALTPGMRAAGGAEATEAVFAAFAEPSRRDAAIASLKRMRTAISPAELTPLIQRRFMIWYTMLGALDEAFNVANASLDDYARNGTIGTAWTFIWMREMLPFRQDPRFQAFVRRLRLFDYWERYGPPDGCELRDGRLICS